MANIKSAQKKARKDIKRTKMNVVYRSKLDTVINTARKARASESTIDVNKTYSVIDKAFKKGVISKQKAARLKAHIAKKK